MTSKLTVILYLEGDEDMVALDTMLRTIDKSAIMIKGHKRIDVKTKRPDEVMPYVRVVKDE